MTPGSAAPEISPQTRLIALLGDPVAHSLSPRFQNAGFRAAAVDAVYLALRCSAADLPGLLRGIAAAGGAGNVTVPHKELAARTVAHRTHAAEQTGACNTFWAEDGEIWGDNTDVVGITRALGELRRGSAQGTRCLVLGAGGAASAAVAALVGERAAQIVVWNRAPTRAGELAQRFGGAAADVQAVATLAELASQTFDLVVNATRLGLHPDDPLPLEADGPIRIESALDLVYRPDETAWVRALRRGGIPAADGLGVLLYQGAAAFERWWQRPAPLEAMRAALPLRAPTDDTQRMAPHAR
jgi:shikimate dehydrogenase